MSKKRTKAQRRAAQALVAGDRDGAAAAMMEGAKASSGGGPGGGKPWPTTVDLLAWWVWWKTWGNDGMAPAPFQIAAAITDFGHVPRLEAHRMLWNGCRAFGNAFRGPDSVEEGKPIFHFEERVGLQ